MQDFIFSLLPDDKSRSAIADRLSIKIQRIFDHSPRMQKDPIRSQKLLVEHWVRRLDAYLEYQDCGHSLVRKSIVGMVCHYFSRSTGRLSSSLGVKTDLLEEFLQEFCIDAMRIFRRESALSEEYQPSSRLEKAEFFTFWEHYAKRSIHFSKNSQTIARLRAQGFIKARAEWREIPIAFDSIDRAIEEGLSASEGGLLQRVREEISGQPLETESDAIDALSIVVALEKWLLDRGHPECVEYLKLRMEDAGVEKIEEQMGLTKRQRDYLQQKFRYHTDKFLLSDPYWRSVHCYLGAPIEERLGLSRAEWEGVVGWVLSQDNSGLDAEIVVSVIENIEREMSDEAIAKASGCTPHKAYRIRAKLLQSAKEIRTAKEIGENTQESA